METATEFRAAAAQVAAQKQAARAEFELKEKEFEANQLLLTQQEAALKRAGQGASPRATMAGPFKQVIDAGAMVSIARFLPTRDALKFSSCGRPLLDAVSKDLEEIDVGLSKSVDLARSLNPLYKMERVYTDAERVAADAALRAVVARSPQITSLVLSYRSHLSAETFRGIDFGCLARLGLRNCLEGYPRDNDIYVIVGQCPRLRALDLSENKLRPEDVTDIVTLVPSLRTLCIDYASLFACITEPESFPYLGRLTCLELYDRDWHPGLHGHELDKLSLDREALKMERPTLVWERISFYPWVIAAVRQLAPEIEVAFRTDVAANKLNMVALHAFRSARALHEFEKKGSSTMEECLDMIKSQAGALKEFEAALANCDGPGRNGRWTCAPVDLDARVAALKEAMIDNTPDHHVAWSDDGRVFLVPREGA
jgi:hypothetical protein